MRVLWGFALCRLIQKIADSLAHLSSRLLGEGKGQDFMGMIYLGKEPQKTTCEQPSFS